jgi:hypothetical protein
MKENTSLITSSEYLKSNLEAGLEPTSEQIRACSDKNLDNSRYYDKYFTLGIDDLIDSMDYPILEELFTYLSSSSHQDIFEPCCQSGLLGCFLAQAVNYKGVDINKIAIGKAKKRAVKNGISPEVFYLGDFYGYPGRHEAIYGRYIINDEHLNLNRDSVEKLKEIADEMQLIQKVVPGTSNAFLAGCRHAMGSSYTTEIACKILYSKATNSDVILLSIRKKPKFVSYSPEK